MRRLRCSQAKMPDRALCRSRARDSLIPGERGAMPGTALAPRLIDDAPRVVGSDVLDRPVTPPRHQAAGNWLEALGVQAEPPRDFEPAAHVRLRIFDDVGPHTGSEAIGAAMMLLGALLQPALLVLGEHGH